MRLYHPVCLWFLSSYSDWRVATLTICYEGPSGRPDEFAFCKQSGVRKDQCLFLLSIGKAHQQQRPPNSTSGRQLNGPPQFTNVSPNFSSFVSVSPIFFVICFIVSFVILYFIRNKMLFLNLLQKIEYHAITSTTYKTFWLCQLIIDLGINHCHSAPLYCDNQSAIHIVTQIILSRVTKHIEIYFHGTHHHL